MYMHASGSLAMGEKAGTGADDAGIRVGVVGVVDICTDWKEGMLVVSSIWYLLGAGYQRLHYKL